MSMCPLYVVPPVYSDQDLEDCFEESGLDDVFFTVDEEVRRITCIHEPNSSH